MTDLLQRVQASIDYILNSIGHSWKLPKAAVICGSGLNQLADSISDPVTISYKDIPHFHTSTVEGHASKLVFGFLDGVPILAMVGRFQ